MPCGAAFGVTKITAAAAAAGIGTAGDVHAMTTAMADARILRACLLTLLSVIGKVGKKTDTLP